MRLSVRALLTGGAAVASFAALDRVAAPWAGERGLLAPAAARLGVGEADATMAAVAALTLLATALAAWLLMRRPTDDLRAFARACDALGAGALDTRLALRGTDAVADAGAAFNAMAGSLERERGRLGSVLEGEQLVADVLSHDVKNQLAAALPRLELLQVKHPALATELGKAVPPIERALAILDDSMLLLRLQSAPTKDGPKEELGALAQAAARSLEPMAEAKKVRIDVRSSNATGEAHPALGRAIENLVSNAVKWSPPGGEVEVRVVPLVRASRVEVADHGPGIPRAQRGQLFTRFRRIDTTKPGHGLGLAIARRIVEQQDGRLWAEDTPGGGATFVIHLPEPRGAAP